MGNNILVPSARKPCPLDSYAAAGGRDGRSPSQRGSVCLLAGVEALAEMMEEDATTVCGARHRRHGTVEVIAGADT